MPALRLLAFLAAYSFFSGAVVAEEPHDTVRKSLVFVHAKALSAEAGQQGTQVEAAGTGFLVSDDGLILTNYHLLEQLGEIFPKSVRFEIAVGERTADRRPAATVDGSEILDLLVLKTPPPAEPFTAVVLGNADAHPSGEQIFTSGFPDNLTSVRKQTGLIEAREGPGGVLWSVDFSLRSGQSGSPVYDRNARVIGVIKGDNPPSAFMIPIDFADGLIAQVRVRELRGRIDALENRIRIAELPDGVATWKANHDDLDLQVSEDEGVCFLTEVWGDFDDARDRVGVKVEGGRYFLTGDDPGDGSLGAQPVCLILK